MRLNVGSGREPLPGWTNLDLNEHAPGVDLVGPAWPLPDEIGNGEVTELRAVDVLEHISYRHTHQVLANWWAAMSKGGELYVQVPDAERCVDWYWNQPHLLIERVPDELPQTPLSGLTWRLLGGQEDGLYALNAEEADFNLHRALFSEESLSLALQAAGFVVERLRVNGHPNLMAWARKP